MDVLTDLLQRSRARGAAFSRSLVHGDFGVEFPRSGTLAVHAIIDGEMAVWTGLEPDPIRVSGGDVLLLHAYPHYLASSAAAGMAQTVPYLDLRRDAAGTGRSRRRGTPADGAAAEFFCGAYLFDGDLSRPLIAALPPLVRLRPSAGSALRAGVDLLVAELDGEGPGQQALLDRLLDVVLVQALRTWFADADHAPGWFRALEEPGLGAALQAVHGDPAHPWTVAELATVASESRSGFSRKFAQIVGVPPLEYVTDWRIALAKERLTDTDDGLAVVAKSVGYASEFSFASAFKRRTGLAPGQWRRQRNRQPGPGPGEGAGRGTSALP